MAKSQADTRTSERDLGKIGEEAEDRLADARRQKAHSQADIEECYFFAAPRRVRSASSQTSTSTREGDAAFELQTSLGFEVAEDFMTMLIDSFLPQAGRWAERLADPSIVGARKAAIERKARDGDERIFQLIRGSNFHAELAKQGVPDAAIGVVAMDIRDVKAHQPIRCLGIPIRELEMNLGPDGRIDDRFVVRHTKHRNIPALLPGLALPTAIRERIANKPNERCEVSWGYWRLWDRDDEAWQHVVMIDKQTIHGAGLIGEGSCPLVIGRFGATPDYAWPDGPMIKALPDLRQVDEMRAAFVENHDFTLRPPIAYDDDGVLSFEDGIEPGMAYPRRPGGGRETLQKIYEPNPIDSALFDASQLERRVRRMHYVDFPEQLGKTPPTLGQWLDEMVEAQKKIGTPGYAFWREFPYEAFQRFRYLAEARAVVQPVEIDGNRMPLQAYNPAQRAQENQEVLTATRLLQIAGSAFPQTMQVAVDDVDTLKNIKEKLGDKLVTMRTPENLKEAVSNLSQLAGVFGPRLQGGLTAANSNG